MIHEKIHDYSKPIIIDFKDLEASEEEDEEEEEEQDKEDFEAARSNFQKQKTISVESRKRYVNKKHKKRSHIHFASLE